MRGSKYFSNYPGYRLRGVRGMGQWLSPRAGSLYNVYDSDSYDPRGAGWIDNIKKAAIYAFAALKRFVLPHIVKSGPDIAKVLADYAAQKAANYISTTEQLGNSKGLITQALVDLPGVVQDIVSKQLQSRFEALPEDVITTLSESGGNVRGSGNRELMAMSTIIDAVPIIRQELDYLEDRFELIDKYGQLLKVGKTRDASEVAEAMLPLLSDDYENRSDIWPILQLVESMITTALECAERNKLIPTKHPLNEFIYASDNLCRCCQSNSVKSVIDNRKKIQMYQKTPGAAAMTLLSPGMGEFDFSNERGGLFGMGAAALASLLVPAIVGSIPSMVTAVSDVVHTHRGGGSASDRAELEELMKDALHRFVNQHLNGSGTNTKRTKAIHSAPPLKRIRKQ